MRTRLEDELMTEVISISYEPRARRGIVNMPADCCVDMRGAVALFDRIDPDVQTIETYTSTGKDTFYIKKGHEWTAIDQRGSLNRKSAPSHDENP